MINRFLTKFFILFFVFAIASALLFSISANLKSRKANQNIDNNSNVQNIDQKIDGISAKAYTVFDLDSKEFILKYNNDLVLPIASLTKIVTLMTSRGMIGKYENIHMIDLAYKTIGNSAKIRIGEVIPYHVLEYPLMVLSSNDVAEAISYHVGRDRFINNMNQLVKDLKLNKTKFVDPTGLSQMNTSTANDLAYLLSAFFDRSRDALSLTTLPEYKHGLHTWKNTIPFLNLSNYLGGKNGFTSSALETGAFVFEINDHNQNKRNVVIIVLYSEDRTKDTNTLLRYIEKTF